jgi:hypothetical protein
MPQPIAYSAQKSENDWEPVGDEPGSWNRQTICPPTDNSNYRERLGTTSL